MGSWRASVKGTCAETETTNTNVEYEANYGLSRRHSLVHWIKRSFTFVS